MTLLGHGHFDTPLETLPDETVLWEGGAAPAATWIRLARLIAAPLVLLALYAAVMVGLFLLVPSGAGRDAAPASAETTASPGPAKDLAKPRVATARPPGASAPVEATPLYPRRQVLTATVYFGVLALVVFVYSRMQTRNAHYVVTSERVCVQSGAITRVLCVIDLDKILSVEITSSWLERRFGLQSLQFVHAGGKNANPYNFARLFGDPYAMTFVKTDGALASKLLNHWLPRDDRRRGN